MLGSSPVSHDLGISWGFLLSLHCRAPAPGWDQKPPHVTCSSGRLARITELSGCTTLSKEEKYGRPKSDLLTDPDVPERR